MNFVVSLVQILLVATLHLSTVKVSLPLYMLIARLLLTIRQGRLSAHVPLKRNSFLYHHLFSVSVAQTKQYAHILNE